MPVVVVGSIAPSLASRMGFVHTDLDIVASAEAVVEAGIICEDVGIILFTILEPSPSRVLAMLRAPVPVPTLAGVDTLFIAFTVLCSPVLASCWLALAVKVEVVRVVSSPFR